MDTGSTEPSAGMEAAATVETAKASTTDPSFGGHRRKPQRYGSDAADQDFIFQHRNSPYGSRDLRHAHLLQVGTPNGERNASAME
jgi:hypothetical protein